ncbi:hypothetical protein AB0K16_44320 [Nonomuraea jabiensis]
MFAGQGWAEWLTGRAGPFMTRMDLAPTLQDMPSASVAGTLARAAAL